ncbi:hypothetical protein MNBD_GAMMA04-2242 [hydrothermal vent metagenome]|uniref:Heme exporter protein D n=1 Tax=hydrothermal vent metagenome TaxID=652676 RepID=A0A3B0VNB0_9ZZZZ
MGIGEFLHMGGHGFYIWGSYGTALFLIILEAFWVSKRRSKAKKELEQMEAEFARIDNQGMNG